MCMLVNIVYFASWTLCLYWLHRLLHTHGAVLCPTLYAAHCQHHAHINTSRSAPRWHWLNMLLYNDSWICTVDLWCTEVIPTVLFAWVTDSWWILAFYYAWAAVIQESVEHNAHVNLMPLFTSGQWHLVHHAHADHNYSLFFPLWDWLHGTHKPVTS
jgi:sterol desaturase/sphingolipid hydroxylase (fatty acid hydroxylase superfamily)